MTDKQKENLFAKLAQQNARAVQAEAATAEEPPPADTPPSPAPVEAMPKAAPSRKKPEPAKGKRDNPAYVQANAYVPKTLRRAVDKVLLDMDDLDYSTLIEDLLRKWLKSHGVSA
jgi:hypothetical protein